MSRIHTAKKQQRTTELKHITYISTISTKKIALALIITTALLSLCSCTEQNTHQTQDGVDTQGIFESYSDTQASQSLVEIDGEQYIGNETSIDLTGKGEKSFDLISEYVQKLPLLKHLNVGESVLTSKDYTTLCESNKNLSIVSKVSFEGITLDLASDEIDISGTKISDKEAFKSILSYVTRSNRKIKFVMCDCGYTNEELQGLRESFPSLDFAWRIYMGKWSLRTDDEAFSVMIYNYDYTRMTSEDISVLRYCTNMYALDLGHQAITDLSVIGELTELRVLILADNKISDVSPLANLKKLQYLELFVNKIQDISPLAACTELVDLNFGWNRSIKDISSIYSLPKIERLWLPTTNVPASKRTEIKETFPNAKIIFEDVDSVSSGWRTHKRYYTMRAMFTNNKYNPDFVT